MHRFVASSDAAIQAVVFTDIADFNQPPGENPFAVDTVSHRTCFLSEVVARLLVGVFNQKQILFLRKAVVSYELFGSFLKIHSDPPCDII